MVELQDSKSSSSPRIGAPYDSGENHNTKNFGRKDKSEKYHPASPSFLEYPGKGAEYPEKERQSEEYLNSYRRYSYDRSEELLHHPPGRQPREPVRLPRPEALGLHISKDIGSRGYSPPFPPALSGRQMRSNSISGSALFSVGREMERDKQPSRYSPRKHSASSEMERSPAAENLAPGAPAPMDLRMFRNEEIDESADSDEGSGVRVSKGRKKIKMEFIKDKGRRGVTFSKRKKGIMKKAYELNVLTKCEILLVVASETGHVYTFATPRLQPIIKQHENLIQHYLNALPGIGEVNKLYETPERYATDESDHYKSTDTYSYDGILRGHGYPSGYYHSGYDTDNSPGSNGPRL